MLGPYRIAGVIGEGGMGVVYRAKDTRLGRDVAVKVLTNVATSDQEQLQRFEQEARTAGMLNHPNLLTIYDVGHDGGGPYIVSELLQGETLRDRLARGPLPPRRAVDAALQVAQGLAAAHEKGIVHRDLKPENIFLTRDGRAKILDFGIAKLTGNSAEGAFKGAGTEPGMVLGTVGYMSPEQVRGDPIDTRSDIFSFGVILYEMLAGHVPFAGDSPTATMMKHLQEPPPPILEERRDLPASVARVVERALAKKPDERFQSAEEMAAALTVAAEDSTAPEAAAVDTGRIIVPTGPNDPARTTLEDDDEATVVSARRRRLPVEAPPPVEDAVPSFATATPPPASGFSPWRVAIPAVAALAIIFAVVYAFQRRDATSSNQPQPQPTLISDPNGQPVQSIAPATGQAERNITPVSATPTPTAGENVPGAGGPNPAASPTPARGHRGEANQQADNENAGDNANEGENDNAKKPSPTPSPRARHVDNVNANGDDAEPPPAPTPLKKQKQPKPEATPSDNPPKLDDDNTPKPADSSSPPDANSNGPGMRL
jgi:serine/threonine protein kinase